MADLFDALARDDGDAIDIQEAKRMLSRLLEPLSALLQGTVTEVMINSPSNIWVEDRAGMRPVELALDRVRVETAITAIGRVAGVDAGADHPIVDARLGNLRVGAVLPPAAVEGPTLCIRRHVPMEASLDIYGEEVAAVCHQLLEAGDNIVVAGATGSGKTTLLNALIAALPEHERLLVLEDTPELTVKASNRVRLETRGADMAALLRQTLRQRPDRIILGELRGGEAYDLIQAANTGHGGSLATIHAGSSQAALTRLASLIGQSSDAKNWPWSAIGSSIASTIGAVIVLKRKRVTEIATIEGVAPDGSFRTKTLLSVE